MKVITSWYISV